ncbi:potassium-transporting ATPase subunit KdpA [Deinococcus metallilatus]|uniref:Potassium-transporting ATPase potassium-binding subunit n=1 Tax=Deinococcus metallilatus TaxID=1211322 RepID=A0AAJ5JX29_9DEIO|nr:potassium-transporting ATPase subunit KdpA [Deinococcus metallilatus]MBB5297208.1 K+-transporting ATPase ATPase A chain [Deinococcus metallilatus]RXJ17347.1 potassium-transporting ATPase subunit KdpA [Deinococcus metallilatus]TLK21816.1 potassium-transporting ATPase subunit KdpA [Deinococcus metallilatus]GMA17227.1 potassium-transporting ATPase potassium-binding subunit [Deinococcus metallilatus]
MSAAVLQMLLLLVIMAAVVVPVGNWLYGVFAGEKHTAPERLTYRLLGVDPAEGMDWRRYGLVLVVSNLVLLLLSYLLIRLQGLLPWNPAALKAQAPDLAWNTAVSFMTNTNWQAYSGEQSLSYFSQMAVITTFMFTSAATGFAGAAAFMRGLAGKNGANLGNFWVDVTRIIYRVFLPLCFVLALVFVWQGMPQTLNAYATATSLEGAAQKIALGPVASLESIKHIGTNGGGFFSMNAAHPFENPTPLTNALHILSMLLLPSALTYAFGRLLGNLKQGWVIFGGMLVMFLGFLGMTYSFEQAGNPILSKLGAEQTVTATQAGGNMEGKEVRFGIAQTALFATTTTAATTGSVDSMHDSYTGMGGFVPMIQMMLNNVFGGKGVGFINFVQYLILSVFIAGLMVGRTPEFLGKKIEAREVKLVMLAVLAHPLSILGFTALACVLPDALKSLNNPGPHGFSEILYAYTSGTANNGSAFAGLGANTPFYNITIGLAMLFGRYLTLLPMLAVAGLLASKRRVPTSSGTLPTDTLLFGGLTVGIILIVGALTFLPALTLGPIADHLQMLQGVVIKP